MFKAWAGVGRRQHRRPRRGVRGHRHQQTIQTIFNPEDPTQHSLEPERAHGLLSLVFWSVTIIVTVL
jgi:hypothetical protein